MAAAYPPSSASSHRGAAFRAPMAAPNAPAGTFLPGTKVQVGSHRVTIEKYLSEGGFAHVYVVRVPRDDNKHDIAVLKRVAVPDKDHLASMRTEVETMKKLKGHRHIVTYMDSHASQLKGGGYEVFLLMEFCGGGGLIDFMNTRLQHRLTEPEILKIFADVSEGVACMHYLKPPLLHRDLKVENVLISKSASSGTPTYKLCDFGSTAPPRPAATTAEEGRLIEEDVQKHTTMQYRSPEMIDVWRKQPIDEKADIWALGVLLYKLCYYTTPFEEVGQMAILNASFKFPHHPPFSERLKKLIGWMLKEDPRQRPNIYQVLKEASSMRGTDVPIKDIYANRTRSEARRNESLPSPTSTIASPPPAVGLQRAVPRTEVQSIPDIAPMRRGRPTTSTQKPTAAAKPSPSPAGGDPFAALDSKNIEVRNEAVEDLSKRFPSLDEFSIVHERGGPFKFGQTSPSTTNPQPAQSSLNERATNALADEVFSAPKTKADLPKAQSTTQLQQIQSPAKARAFQQTEERSRPASLVQQSSPVSSAFVYKSTGTGPSPPTQPARPITSKPQVPEPKQPDINKRPIWRVPSPSRASSQPRASETAQATAASLQPSLPPTQRPALLDVHRSKSQTATIAQAVSQSSASSRPSLEGRRPSQAEMDGDSLTRAKSAQSRPRPTSVYVSSNLDYLRNQEQNRKTSSETKRSMEARRNSRQSSPRLMPSTADELALEDTNIDNDMDFLRRNEENDASKWKLNRKESSGNKKRTSLPSISGAKNIFAGRFGDAFKRFEVSSGDVKKESEAEPRTPVAAEDGEEPRFLSPIQGSEATPSKYSDNDSPIGVEDDIPPEVRRELERQRLSQEERRVAEAAAEHRARVAANGTGGNAGHTRASTIQKRVQSLLEEGRQSPGPKKTAEGYGKYTDQHRSEEVQQQQQQQQQQGLPPRTSSMNAPSPQLARKPIADPSSMGFPLPRTRQQPPSSSPVMSPPIQASPSPASAISQQPTQRIVSRPSAPPKPKVLRTGQWPPAQSPAIDKPLTSKPTGLAALLAKDLEGVPDYPGKASGKPHQGNVDGPDEVPAVASGLDDIEADFSKRYPSLSGIELVEREIGGSSQGSDRIRVREV